MSRIDQLDAIISESRTLRLSLTIAYTALFILIRGLHLDPFVLVILAVIWLMIDLIWFEILFIT